MSKFKEGDKVRVREDLIVDKSYGPNTFVSMMNQYKGETGKIMTCNVSQYKIDVDGKRWNWTDQMLEPVGETLPEKWCVKATDESEQTLEEWRGGGHNGRPAYMCSHKMWISEAVVNAKGYTEISFDEFRKHVLKEKVQKEHNFPKTMLVGDYEDDIEQEEEVLAYIEGQEYPYITKDGDETYLGYKYAKDLPEKVTLTKEEIAEKFGIDVEQLEIEE